MFLSILQALEYICICTALHKGFKHVLKKSCSHFERSSHREAVHLESQEATQRLMNPSKKANRTRESETRKRREERKQYAYKKNTVVYAGVFKMRSSPCFNKRFSSWALTGSVGQNGLSRTPINNTYHCYFYCIRSTALCGGRRQQQQQQQQQQQPQPAVHVITSIEHQTAHAR